MKSGIYLIKNTVNGKGYVGRSVNLRSRRVTHRYSAFRKEYNYPLYRAMRKYGEEAFSFEVLEYADGELHVLEQAWIERLGTRAPYGYNVGPTNNGWTSEMAKARDEAIRLRRAQDPEYDAKWRATNREVRQRTWRNNPERTRQTYRQRLANDPEFRASVSAKNKANGAMGSKKTKPVSCGGVVYESIREAARQLGMTKTGIRHRINSSAFPDHFFI